MPAPFSRFYYSKHATASSAALTDMSCPIRPPATAQGAKPHIPGE